MHVRKFVSSFLVLCLILALITGCGVIPKQENPTPLPQVQVQEQQGQGTENSNAGSSIDVDNGLAEIPEYQGYDYTEINGNVPYFTEDEKARTDAFETYSELDSTERCGVAYANICKELMPIEPRGSIGMVKPSGWHTAKYDFVDGKYLYNRCHLIGYQLAGENANEKNLITGTRHFNVVGMLPFENEVADYIDDNPDNHVLYRVTPMYEGNNLVASGVLMEAWSVEDDGNGVCFNVFVYNVEPGVIIDYATGENWLDESSELANYKNPDTQDSEEDEAADYVVNTNSGIYHKPDCDSVGKMSEKNKLALHTTKKELADAGYKACGSCRP